MKFDINFMTYDYDVTKDPLQTTFTEESRNALKTTLNKYYVNQKKVNDIVKNIHEDKYKDNKDLLKLYYAMTYFTGYGIQNYDNNKFWNGDALTEKKMLNTLSGIMVSSSKNMCVGADEKEKKSNLCKLYSDNVSRFVNKNVEMTFDDFKKSNYGKSQNFMIDMVDYEKFADGWCFENKLYDKDGNCDIHSVVNNDVNNIKAVNLIERIYKKSMDEYTTTDRY